MAEPQERNTERELVALTRSGRLSVDEQKKVLAIMMTLGQRTGSAARTEAERPRTFKILMTALAVLTALFMGAAWYMLKNVEKKLPPACNSTAEPLPGGPGR